MTASGPNVETVRRLFESFARQDLDAVIEIFDPEVEFKPLSGQGRVYHGREQVRGYFEDLAARGGQIEATSHQFIEKDDFVVVLGSYRLRDPAGFTDSSAAWVMKLRDGSIVESSGYSVSADALEAVGMRIR
jgi:ketosteroid isomerase-like protein